MKYDYTGDKRDGQDTNCFGDLGESFGDALGGTFGGDRDRGTDLLRSRANGRFVPGDAPEVDGGRRNPNNGHYTGPTEGVDLGFEDGDGSLLGDSPGRALAGIEADVRAFGGDG